ncbi:MAG: hypothetical protein F6K41_10160 [Symploca sp. SIO3E6]|nr:hypothetical protein [Caldora sp. SIO3E6]
MEFILSKILFQSPLHGRVGGLEPRFLDDKILYIDMLQAIQNFLLLRRQITVKVEIPITSAKINLVTALSQEIVLTGEFQLTRRYWGHLSENHLTFYGPRANRQFCFLVKGNLSDEGSQTWLNGKMHLRTGDFYQLFCAVVTIFVLLLFMFRWSGMIFLPVFLGFIYGMVQWHFQWYAEEITQLLTDLMAGKRGETRI